MFARYRNILLCRCLERYSVFEDGDFAVAVDFVASRFARGNREDFVYELRHKLLHSLAAINELSGIEVYPVGLAVVEVAVGG